MAKLTRNEVKELAALVLKTIKTARPDLTNKEIRSICSSLYHQSKKAEQQKKALV